MQTLPTAMHNSVSHPTLEVIERTNMVTIERDEKEAIDETNIIEGKTGDAAKSTETYHEPSDEEGLPTDDGTSAVAQ